MLMIIWVDLVNSRQEWQGKKSIQRMVNGRLACGVCQLELELVQSHMAQSTDQKLGGI